LFYDNGPYNGTTDAWTINFGFATSDSFTGSGTINDLQFVYWNASTSDLLTSVDMAVGSTSFSGDFQTSNGVTNTFLGTNQFGYALYHAEVTFPGVSGGPGYVTLQNACTTSGCSVSNPIYWDENSGIGCTSQGCPSTAYENNLGSIPSETFTLSGDGSSGCMPEHDGNFKVIHDFTGQGDGTNPNGLVINAAGNLFGPAGYTVYKLSQAGSGWVLSSLYTFTEDNYRDYPREIVIGQSGVLYGAAWGELGGCYSGNCGFIFGLRPAPTACRSISCYWTENLVYRFTEMTDDGHSLVADATGNLYGVSTDGGAQQHGVFFQLTPSIEGWIETILYSFSGDTDGGGPTTLFLGKDGNLYGLAGTGGAYGGGVVFQLTPSANGWTETVLYNLPNEMFGTNPHSLLQDRAGNLFGEYWYTDPNGNYGNVYGIVFMLSPSSGGWLYTELARGSESYEQDYFVNLAIDAAGNLYGTGYGVTGGCINPVFHGYVFELKRVGGGWSYTTPVYWDNTIFDAGGALAMDAQGNLYGTTRSCGSHQYGTVWEFTPTQ
jgi:uncharacterized repeat protein (TIGR03803 family)